MPLDLEKKRKAEQLFVYIAHTLEDNRNFGSVLLNKIFWHIDNLYFAEHGESITHFTYVKQDQGPTPDPKLFMPLREELITCGVIKLEDRLTIDGKVQKRITTNREPDMSQFVPEEMEIIKDVIYDLRWLTAKEASDDSHEYLSWQLADHMEDLPFSTYLLTRAEPSADDLKWAQTKAKELDSKAIN